MATHARIFYYAQRIGVQIDFNKYNDWLARNPDHNSPDILPTEFLSAEKSSQEKGEIDQVTSGLEGLSTTDKGKSVVLAWQSAAPKADLYIDKSTLLVDGSTAAAEPSYPARFAEMLELLKRGEPIPGIRQIPDTVVRDPVSLNFYLFTIRACWISF
jgi:hypothetical protein